MTSYLRDESKLHNASAAIILLDAFAWILLVVDVIFLITSNYKVVYGIILVGIICFGIFTDTYYNYYECVKISFGKNKILYEYKLNSTLAGDRSVRVNIKDITKIRFKRKKAIIHGNITKKQPLAKERELKKIEIPTNFGKDTNKIIENLRAYVGGN